MTVSAGPCLCGFTINGIQEDVLHIFVRIAMELCGDILKIVYLDSYILV